MAHSDGRRRYGNNPKTRTTPTMEKLLQGDASWRPASTLPTTTSPRLAKDHDPEEDHTQHHKKSVLSKVKERAKKLRHSLSYKKHDQDGNTTPSWGVSLDDDEDEEDPEYFGAPMYESELAPEGYKETARQQPRAVPEKHMLATNVEPNIDQGTDQKSPSPDKTSTETMTEKLVPEYVTVSEPTHAIASKIQCLAVSSLTKPAIEEHACSREQQSVTETVTEKLAPAYTVASEATHAIASKIQGLAVSSPTEPVIGGHACSDKLSMKECLMHKFEPGEEDRSLSHGISEAMSPRKSSGDMGVVQKVKRL